MRKSPGTSNGLNSIVDDRARYGGESDSFDGRRRPKFLPKPVGSSQTRPVSCDRSSAMPALGRFLLVPALFVRIQKNAGCSHPRGTDVWIHAMIDNCNKDE